MNKLGIFAFAVVSLSLLGAALPASQVAGQQTAQQTSAVERVNAAGQIFIAAIAARDLQAMEKLWAHEPYVTFIGPLSTTVVVGWDGVKKAWEMRFSQFDRVTISLADSHVHSNGNRRRREGPAAAKERRDSQLRCLRDERLRGAAGRPLAHGFPPCDANLQAGEVARASLFGSM
jgi:ketosteroid isomerase-like protein